MPLTSATATINVLDSTLLVSGVTTLTVGGKVYTFKTTPTLEDDIGINASDSVTAANIAIAVTEDTATTLCTASAQLDVVTLTANTGGTAGNDIVLSETAIPTALTVTAFAGGSSNTTYATIAELKPLVGNASSASDALLQRILNSAARLFDQETRRYVVEGQEAYSASVSQTRYFDDLVRGGHLEIHDLLSTSGIVRGSTTVPAANYKLLPLNRGNGPYTSIQWGQAFSIERDTEDHWYYSTHDIVTGGIAITGVWGYCTAANRPDAVKQAVLDLSSLMYKTEALTLEQVMNMITPRDPMTIIARNVAQTIKAFKRAPEYAFV